MNDYPIIAFPSEIRSEYQELLQNDPEFAKFIADAKRQQELMRPFYEAEMREEEERAGRMKYIMEYFKNRGKQKEWFTEMKRGREMNEQKTFNIGDRVRMKRTVCFDYITFEKGCVGEVSSDEDTKGFCRIRMKNAESGEMTEHFICACNLERIDSKLAFLSDLAAVLRKHNAVINVGWNGNHSDGYPCIDVNIQFENSNRVACLEDVLNWSITADTIMDYDKEWV